MILTLFIATIYCVIRYAMDWPSNFIPAMLILILAIGSLSLSPMVYKDDSYPKNKIIFTKDTSVESE